MRIRPAARHQLPMPAQKRRRRHQERRPHPSRQRPTKRGEQRPIVWAKLRTSDLALEHVQLVAQNEDLDLLLPVRAHPQHKQLQQPPQHPVQEQEHRAPRTTHLERRPYRHGTHVQRANRTPTTDDLNFRHPQGLSGTGTSPTNASGDASFSFVGASPGTDTLEASFVDGLGNTHVSNDVTVTWEGPITAVGKDVAPSRAHRSPGFRLPPSPTRIRLPRPLSTRQRSPGVTPRARPARSAGRQEARSR